ncbi:hypothetical protein AGDE_16244 [Angomonas deanei]|uniref:Uncharacterized protein n=1 Tax=Angomonas deanei TaxID=59799 RepID=A0A7G2CAR9_9TRYP|nr:hypothetical protein AGDE_16244 [Angomonas deanei]CAD2216007.1 hypothetical protein, conserved [Angomonas deanei]|eukprot:EPY17461.1 hypothetical protein AGDE_16244 [Angomonas deanei]
MKIKIVLYVDQDRTPKVLPTTSAPHTIKELQQHIGQLLGDGKEPKTVSFWQYSSKSYQSLQRVEQLKQREALLSKRDLQQLEERNERLPPSRPVEKGDSGTVYRAQLWVETALLVLEPLEPQRDAEELAELSNHVRKWTGNKYIVYDLLQASRVYYPTVARLFDTTRQTKLHDNKEEVRLLYYTNNCWSGREVLRFGFLLQDDLPQSEDSKTTRRNTRRDPFIFSSCMMTPATSVPRWRSDRPYCCVRWPRADRGWHPLHSPRYRRAPHRKATTVFITRRTSTSGTERRRRCSMRRCCRRSPRWG